MTCASCEHSEWRAGVGRGAALWCVLKDAPAVRRCVAWIYAPGSDESEREG